MGGGGLTQSRAGDSYTVQRARGGVGFFVVRPNAPRTSSGLDPQENPPPAGANDGTGPSVGYMPALDGLRALAVVAVVLYHGEVGGIPGGFLGVEIFFVISGYLITALLLSERQRTGSTAYVAFWIRRAKRLLPALFALIAVVGTVWVVFHQREVAQLRGDMVGALTYVTNWYQIIVKQSYFEAIGRPSPLRHLWSLAVEEQFYIMWPVVLAVIFKVTRARRNQMILVTLGLALVSVVAAIVMFSPGTDPSRIYYGTDTRASGVLLGAALAIAVPPWLMTGKVVAGARKAMTAIGLVGLLGLTLMITQVSEFDSFLYRGGFALVDLLTIAVILALVHPCRTVWSRLFALAPLLWVGRRSYGIYLWHWPIFVLTRPGLDIPLHGWPLLSLRLALTMMIAELSYRFVEMPVRNGALGRWWVRRSQPGGLVAPRARKPVLTGTFATLLIVGAIVIARPPSSNLDGVDLAGLVIDSMGNVTDEPASSSPSAPKVSSRKSTSSSTTIAGSTTSSTIAATTSSVTPATSEPSEILPAVTPILGASVTAIGDSVLLGARSAVRSALPGLAINAEVSRQFNVLSWLLPTLANAGSLRSRVVINLGTNGPPTDKNLKAAFDALAGQQRVVIMTIRAPRSWQDVTNERIWNAAAGRPNVVVADWYSVSEGHPEYFVSDGIHLSTPGAEAFAATMASAVG